MSYQTLTFGRVLGQVTVVDVSRLAQRLLTVCHGRSQLVNVFLFFAVGRLDYVVGRVVRERTMQPYGGQERN